MALYPREIEEQPQVPDYLAHEADSMAEAAHDATNNTQTLERKVQRNKNDPMQQKLLDASSGSILLYLVFTAAYFAMLYWEWTVSREIYEVLIPVTYPWAPFVCIVLLAFYGSACLGESSTHFALFSHNQGNSSTRGDAKEASSALEYLYNQRKKRDRVTNWFLHPVTGALVAVAVVAVVYYMSTRRVALLEAAGEAPDADFQTYLPAGLYAIEILLGIPAFFSAMWAFATLRARWLRMQYTEEKRIEATLRQAAVGKATDYLAELEAYNDWARQCRRPERPMVPFGRSLRSLLQEEWGYDPTTGAQPNSGSNGSSQANGSDTAPGRNGTPPASNGQGTVSGNGGGSREEDLLNLLDEQINRQNRSL